jgi:hypothetical protein
MNLADLKKPLPEIHWRSQSMNKEGNQAMALAYMDARDVMDRLDAVCGVHCWQDSYVESVRGRVICTISILIGDQWISKSDGAGDTAVEGEKGGISDAFKRAAVKWGIGRYLYDMGAPWAECESYEKGGKRYFKKWTPAGLSKLAKVHPAAPQVELPIDASLMITDEGRDIIIALASSIAFNVNEILQAYNIKDLRELTAKQAEVVTKRLNTKIDEKRIAAEQGKE